eukprot:scaffold356530_cov59-Attheya_sp.AAC.2
METEVDQEEGRPHFHWNLFRRLFERKMCQHHLFLYTVQGGANVMLPSLDDDLIKAICLVWQVLLVGSQLLGCRYHLSIPFEGPSIESSASLST